MCDNSCDLWFMPKEAKANSNCCHSNAIANPPTQIMSLWPTYTCNEELVGPYCHTRRWRSEARSMLVELETRRSESSGWDRLDLVFFGVCGHKSSSMVDLGLGWFWMVEVVVVLGLQARIVGLVWNFEFGSFVWKFWN